LPGVGTTTWISHERGFYLGVCRQSSPRSVSCETIVFFSHEWLMMMICRFAWEMREKRVSNMGDPVGCRPDWGGWARRAPRSISLPSYDWFSYSTMRVFI
jgi:hypothetical protein